MVKLLLLVIIAFLFVNLADTMLTFRLFMVFMCEALISFKVEATLHNSTVLLLVIVRTQVTEEEATIGIVLEYDSCSLSFVG